MQPSDKPASLKRENRIIAVFLLVVVATATFAYLRGRRDVWLEDYKIYSGNLMVLTSFKTNAPPEIKEFLKGRYYYVANKLSANWLGEVRDYGPVSTNYLNLGIGKGPTSAQEEYRNLKARNVARKATAKRRSGFIIELVFVDACAWSSAA
jgi:hypothetical protein